MKIQNADPSQESSLFDRIKSALTKTVENFAHGADSITETEFSDSDVDYDQSETFPVYDFFEPKPKRRPQQYIPYLKRNQNKIYQHANTQMIQLEKSRRHFMPTKIKPSTQRLPKYTTTFPWTQYY